MPTLAGVKTLETKDVTSPAELKALKRVFLTLDTKKDEVIDWTEISDACVKLGFKASMKEIREAAKLASLASDLTHWEKVHHRIWVLHNHQKTGTVGHRMEQTRRPRRT